MSNGSYVRTISEPPHHRSTSCRRVRGFYLGEGTLDGPGDKYPSDIMDGVCIRPQRNDGTNPIRFADGFAGARAHTHVTHRLQIRIDEIDISDKFMLFMATRRWHLHT